MTPDRFRERAEEVVRVGDSWVLLSQSARMALVCDIVRLAAEAFNEGLEKAARIADNYEAERKYARWGFTLDVADAIRAAKEMT